MAKTFKSRFITDLREVTSKQDRVVGGKAKNLALLLRNGFQVPAGFCILTGAFEEFINSAPGLLECFKRIERVSPENIEKIREEAKFIRELLSLTAIPEDVKKDIIEAWSSLGQESYYAVRSSATAEDLETASFAGQQDTYLNVKGKEDIIKSVRECWISMFNERAISYRINKGVDQKTAHMAVVIQKMVNADLSGVVFTVNPVTGNRRQMVIEYAKGLGEALVSGRVTPMNLIVDKDNLSVLGSSNDDLKHCHNKLLIKLSRIAKRIEKRIGRPQDIEWAALDGELFILQARPITTIPEEKDQTVWSNVNMGEIMPNVVTPLFYTFFEELAVKVFKPFSRLFGVNFDKESMFGLIAGRAYANLSVFGKMLSNMPGPAKMDISDVFGGMPADISILVNKKPSKKKRLLEIGLLLCSPFLLIVFAIFGNKKRTYRILKEMRNISETMTGDDYSKLSMEELLKRVHWCDVWGKKVFASGMCMGTGMGFMMGFIKLCKKWLKDEKNAIGNKLLTGVGNMASADAGRDLIKLAFWVEKNEELKDAIIGAVNFEILRKEAHKSRELENFLEKWGQFMLSHGHHARGEVDLYIPRWSEQPDYILEMLKGYVGKTKNFTDIQEQRERERDELLEKVLSGFANPLKRGIFTYFMNKAREGLAVRENFKSEVVRMLSIARKSVLEIDKRWIDRGILEEKDDIFFITVEELDKIYEGKVPDGLRGQIYKRREEFEKNLSLTPPPVVIGTFDPNKTENIVKESEEDDLKGIAVSSGVARGVARVVTSCECEEKVLPGEILVAPFTDPGWTPYFLNASAIVMDMGGMLSHGSIVAREYGIPAVVNVGPATRYIKSGQVLEVDGDNGIVRIIK